MARSQAKAGPSQSQRPTQTQKPRGRRAAVVEEEPEEEAQEDEQDEELGDGMDVDSSQSEVARKANELVRLALFMEHRRTVLRREDINKKVIGNGRNFNMVFAAAQTKLRDTFGMELVELPSRAGLDKDGDEPNEAQLATGAKKKAAALGSKTYIVRSTLAPILIEHGAQTDEQILEAENEDQEILFPSQTHSDDDNDPSDEDEERPSKFYGSIISWSRADQLGSVGVLYVILSLVLVGGRVISDLDLRRYLKTLHLPSNPSIHPIHHTASATTRALNLDAYLSNLLRLGYLDRVEVGGDAVGKKGKKGAAKRLRTQAEDLEDGRTYEWRWGPRAFCEVGEQAVAQFVADFMVSNHDGEDDGMDEARHEALVQKMYKGIEKGAGGKLTDLR